MNKVNTKATAKLLIDEAVWLPEDVRNRLKRLQANRINKEGYLLVSSDTHRYAEHYPVIYCVIMSLHAFQDTSEQCRGVYFPVSRIC